MRIIKSKGEKTKLTPEKITEIVAMIKPKKTVSK
jgi:hypothetical protein